MSSAGHIMDMIRRIQSNRAYQTNKKHQKKDKIASLRSRSYVPDGARIVQKEYKSLKVFNAIVIMTLILLMLYIIISNLIT
jgi:hypothetical protein